MGQESSEIINGTDSLFVWNNRCFCTKLSTGCFFLIENFTHSDSSFLYQEPADSPLIWKNSSSDGIIFWGNTFGLFFLTLFVGFSQIQYKVLQNKVVGYNKVRAVYTKSSCVRYTLHKPLTKWAQTNHIMCHKKSKRWGYNKDLPSVTTSPLG